MVEVSRPRFAAMAFEGAPDVARYFRRSRVTVRSTTLARESRVRKPAPARAWDGVLDHLVLLKPRVMSLVVFTGGRRLRACAGADGLDEAPRRRFRRWPEGQGPAARSTCGGTPISTPIWRGRRCARFRAAWCLRCRRWRSEFCSRSCRWPRLRSRSMCLAAALLVLTIAIYVPLYTMVLKRSTPHEHCHRRRRGGAAAR